MDASWLKYCITDEQLQAFNDQGYLIVEDALSPQMVDALSVSIFLMLSQKAQTPARGKPCRIKYLLSGCRCCRENTMLHSHSWTTEINEYGQKSCLTLKSKQMERRSSTTARLSRYTSQRRIFRAIYRYCIVKLVMMDTCGSGF